MRPDAARGEVIRSDIPARLDALAWSRWHRRVVVALGVTWILDGLEASLIANLAPTLQDERTLGLRAAQVGLANTVYLLGQVAGALVFGHLTDRFGRKRLFLVDLGINGSYWIGVALGAGLTLALLNPSLVPVEVGWRLVFGLGALLGLVILLVRRDVPESPRWVLMHGFVGEARATMELIESRVREGGAVVVEATRGWKSSSP